MKAYGPDGRAWSIVRRTDPPGVLQGILPGSNWVVEATASDEVRRWRTSSRRAARALVVEVALALRTGGEGPPGELAVDDDPPEGLVP